MLSENLRRARAASGLSQTELAARLNVVRQTVSKWETGLSVPDAELLIALAEALHTSVGALLGEAVAAPEEEDRVRALSAQLEVVNAQLARQADAGAGHSARRIRGGGRAGAAAAGRACVYGAVSVPAAADAAGRGDGDQDGPTGILVRAQPGGLSLLLAALLGIAAVAGLALTRRRG